MTRRTAIQKISEYLLALVLALTLAQPGCAGINAIRPSLGAINSGSPGFFPVGHWVAAKLPMTVIFPRPDGETNSYAREHWAYWDGTNAVKYVIPIEVQGGAYPYVFQLTAGPPGASIEQSYWVGGDTPAQMLAAGYGDFVWTPQGNISSPWTGNVSVLVTGQDHSSITVSFTLSTAGAYATSSYSGTATVNGTASITINTVGSGTLGYGMVLSGTDIPAGDYITGQTSGTAGGTGVYTLAQAATGSAGPESVTGSLQSGFVFIDATCSSCDTSGSGTITSPWQTLNKIYGASRTTTYPGAILYLRGNSSSVNYQAYEQTGGVGPGIELSSTNNPVSVLGFPGDPTPDIDICGLNATVNKDDVFYPFNNANDLFIQGLTFSGTPGAIDGTCTSAIGSTTNQFSYIWVNYNINRLTYDNLSFPNVWTGSSTSSGNSTDLEFDLLTWPALRQYVTIHGVSETNRPTGYQDIGIYDAYSTQYAVADFNTFTGSASAGIGYAYGRKDTDYDWTNRYNFASGGATWLFWQGGFLTSGASANNDMEDCYNTIVSTASTNPSAPGQIYNQSAAQQTTNTYSYRNSLVNTGEGVAQSSTTGNGPFWFDNDAIQYGTNLSQGITFSTTGNTPYSGGAFPSNVTDATSAGGISACQASSGVFNGSNQLTGACAASYAGRIGARIQ